MLAAAMLLPLALALAMRDGEQVLHFAYALMWVLFGSGLLIATTRRTAGSEGSGGSAGSGGAPPAPRPPHWLLVGAAVWGGVPLWGALPLWGNQGLGFGAAWFESLSGFTTTGATMLAQPDTAPAAILLWRSLLNGCGAVWTIVFALAIALPLRCGGLDCKSWLLGERDTDMAAALRQQTLVVTLVFGLAALGGALGLMLSGMPPLWAVCLALSGLSTGGFAPTAMPLASALPPGGLAVLSLLVFAGAVSFPLWPGSQPRTRVRGARAGARAALRAPLMLRDGEWRGFCLWLALWAVGGALAWGWQPGEAFLVALNFVSTAGFVFVPAATLGGAAAVWLLVPMLVGGMSLSTAGGSKMLRALLVWRSVRQNVRRLVAPHAADRVRLAGHQVTAAHVSACWTHFAALMLLLGGGLLLGSWLLNLDLPHNLQFVVANLGNVNYQALGGPLAEAGALSGAGMVLAGALMLAGRMEFVLFLLIIHPLLWRSLREL